jgi:hypothetical protein
MTGEIVFYQLSSKYVERDEDVPEAAREVVYYSLAIGHHIGVFDCFTPKLRCPGAVYARVLDALSADAEARRKLERLLEFSEIQVDRSHTALLRSAIDRARGDADAEVGAWFDTFDQSLAAIEQEPAIYLMGRRLP